MTTYLEVFDSASLYNVEVKDTDFLDDPPVFWGYGGDSDADVEQDAALYEDGMMLNWFDKFARARH